MRRLLSPWALTRACPALVLGLGASSCVFVKSPGANAWNLSQLHYPSGSYHYTADLVGGFEYVMRSGTSGLPLKSSIQDPLGAKQEAVKNPSQETLENLIALSRFDTDDERIAGLKVMWYSRLAVQDPSKLCRERCVIELAALGERVEIGVPVELPPDADPVGPEELGVLLAALIREYRGIIDDDPTPGDYAQLGATCAEIEATVFDLDGGRRILFAVNNLLLGSKKKGEARAPLQGLSRAAQKQCIQLALAGALGDAEPIVRAAAVRSSVEAVGIMVIAPILMQLNDRSSVEVQATVMEIIAEHGLPDAPPGMDAETYELVRENWIYILYSAAVNQPDGHLQIQAMRAMRKVAPPGVDSLRDEEWVRWWQKREAELVAAESGAEADQAAGAIP